MSRISFIQFKKDLGRLGVFSVRDIEKVFPFFDSRRLVEWQEKGYVKRIANRLYLFSDLELDETTFWWISNRICDCSYISLETALSYYSLIPEGVFSITAVRTGKTKIQKFGDTEFSFRSFKPSLYFGYKMLKVKKWHVRFAEPEKAVLDYLYFNTDIRTEADFVQLRINTSIFKEIIEKPRFYYYADAFSNLSLMKRLRHFCEFIYA